MKKFSSALCALACLAGANTTHALETTQTVSLNSPSDIDSILNELSATQNQPTSLLRLNSYESNSYDTNANEPESLATNSALISSGFTTVTESDEDVLSHLTLVASNSVSNFKQSGRASWYGGKFHGRQTASGERFDMHSMTAAHRSLPFNTYLKVTNKSNGQSVVVKVNDRGPFHGNRILDLSYGAAKKIGLVSRGVGNVSIERVSAP